MNLGPWVDAALVASIVGGAGVALFILAWRRRHGPRWTLLDVAIAFATFIGAASVGSLLALHWSTGHYVPVGEPPVLPAVAATGVGSGIAVTGVFLRARPRELALRGPVPWGWVGWALLGVPPFLLLSAAWVALLQWIGLSAEPQRLVDWLGGGAEGKLAVAFYAVLYAPFVEELLFRGFLLPPLLRRLGPSAGLVVGGALFGLLHASDPTAMAPLAVLGLALGYLRHRSGSLWPSLCLHVANNTVALSLTLWSAAQAGAV